MREAPLRLDAPTHILRRYKFATPRALIYRLIHTLSGANCSGTHPVCALPAYLFAQSEGNKSCPLSRTHAGEPLRSPLCHSAFWAHTKNHHLSSLVLQVLEAFLGQFFTNHILEVAKGEIVSDVQ
jgi:hypothetical protein